MRKLGAEVDDFIIYKNEQIVHKELPDFDAVFFASASGVESFIGQWGAVALSGKTITVIGLPTADALKLHNFEPDVLAQEATIAGAIQSLAEFCVSNHLKTSGITP